LRRGKNSFNGGQIGRRAFLSLAAVPLAGATRGIPEDLKTPYKIGRLVVAPSEAAGDFDSQGADCPFVYHHGGRFWMTYVGFDGIGYQTGLASSHDLASWKREGLIIRRDRETPLIRYSIALTWILRENDVFAPGRLRRVRGRFLGVYHAYPKPGYEQGPAVIGLCWSSDLRKWEIEPPCLRAEDGADWERGGLYKACIVEQGGRYFLVYNAKDEGRRWKEHTGVAVSRDLRTWTRLPANPYCRPARPAHQTRSLPATPASCATAAAGPFSITVWTPRASLATCSHSLAILKAPKSARAC